jgi:hypothetical protein
MRIQTTFYKDDEAKLYERMATQVNNKAESFLQIYIDTVNVGQQIAQCLVSASSTLYVISLTVLCETPGVGGGAGLVIRLSGGAANQDIVVLTAGVTSNSFTQATFGTSTEPGYEVPSNGTLTITELSSAFAASDPEKIRLTFGLRCV